MVDREGRPLEAVMGNEHGELVVEVRTCTISTRRAPAKLIQWLRGELFDLDLATRWAP